MQRACTKTLVRSSVITDRCCFHFAVHRRMPIEAREDSLLSLSLSGNERLVDATRSYIHFLRNV